MLQNVLGKHQVLFWTISVWSSPIFQVDMKNSVTVLQAFHTALLLTPCFPHCCNWPLWYMVRTLLSAHPQSLFCWYNELPYTTYLTKAVFPTTNYILTPCLTQVPLLWPMSPWNHKNLSPSSLPFLGSCLGKKEKLTSHRSPIPWTT